MSDPSLPCTVLRLPAVYGPGDRQHRVGDLLRRMDAGRSAIVLDEGLAGWGWTRGYVENIAEAIALAVTDERAAGQIYNLGEADPLSWAEWVAAIGEAADWHGEIVVLPRAELPPELQTDLAVDQPFVAATEHFRRDLGYAECVERTDGLRRAVEWERENPHADGPAPDYAAEDAVLARRAG